MGPELRQIMYLYIINGCYAMPKDRVIQEGGICMIVDRWIGTRGKFDWRLFGMFHGFKGLYFAYFDLGHLELRGQNK